MADQLGIEHKFNILNPRAGGKPSLEPLLWGPDGLDARARLALHRGIEAVHPTATPLEKREFVNQLGAYNKALEATLEKFLKKTLIAPFYTAGKTMGLNGVREWNPIGSKLPKSMPFVKRASLIFAEKASVGVAGYLGTWALVNKALNDKYPWEIPGLKLGQVLLGKSGKVFDMNFLNPLIGRGARGLGIRGYYNTKMAGGSNVQAEESGLRDIGNTLAHPITSGPAVRGAMAAVLGKEPQVTSSRDYITGANNIDLRQVTNDFGGGLSQGAANIAAGLTILNPVAQKLAESPESVGLNVKPLLRVPPAKSADDAESNNRMLQILNLMVPETFYNPITDFTGDKDIMKAMKLNRTIENHARREEYGPAVKPLGMPRMPSIRMK
jgi:hypothetical protein